MIHCGTSDFDSTDTILDFAKHHRGTIIIAHAARLNVRVLMLFAELDNIFIDACPSNMLFNNKEKALYPPLNYKLKTPQDIYLQLLTIFPSNRILFGTDFPWGNMKEELETVLSLPISDTDIENILYKAALKIFDL